MLASDDGSIPMLRHEDAPLGAAYFVWRPTLGLNSLFGLPAHPLLVHGAVVLVPLAVIGFVGTGWRPIWRQQWGPVILVLAATGWAFAFLATRSGDPLEEHVRNVAAAAGRPRPRFGDHPELGNTAALLSFFFAAAVGLWFALDRWVPLARRSRFVATGSYVGVTAVGLLALGWILQAGHTGAQLVWGK